MIKAQEAIRLTKESKENYRKQERIALENKVSAEIEKAARKGYSDTGLLVEYQDEEFIIQKLQNAGFQIGKIREMSDKKYNSIDVSWIDSMSNCILPEAITAQDARDVAEHEDHNIDDVLKDIWISIRKLAQDGEVSLIYDTRKRMLSSSIQERVMHILRNFGYDACKKDDSFIVIEW